MKKAMSTRPCWSTWMPGVWVLTAGSITFMQAGYCCFRGGVGKPYSTSRVAWHSALFILHSGPVIDVLLLAGDISSCNVNNLKGIMEQWYVLPEELVLSSLSWTDICEAWRDSSVGWKCTQSVESEHWCSHQHFPHVTFIVFRFFTGLALLQQEEKASEDAEKEAAMFLQQGLEHFINQRCSKRFVCAMEVDVNVDSFSESVRAPHFQKWIIMLCLNLQKGGWDSEKHWCNLQIVIGTESAVSLNVGTVLWCIRLHVGLQLITISASFWS